MADPVPAATTRSGGPGPSNRAWLTWLVVLLAVHAGLAAWAVTQTPETPWYLYRYDGVLRVSLIALAAFGVAIVVWGRYTHAIAWNGGILVAASLLTPAVVLLVAVQLLNAYVIGDRIIARANARTGAAYAPPFAVATLTGISVWIGIMAAVAPFRIHFLPVYAAAMMLPLLLWWRTTGDILHRAGRVLVQRGPLPAASERCWTVLLMTMVVLHLFVVAKPEAGYDALAMHLQVPLLMSGKHYWAFDVTRWVWAVMPLGADWAFTVAYFMGGEGAARLLNFAFAVVACQMLYALIRRSARSDIALASICLVASTPLAFLETSTLYVENLWLAFLLGTLLVALDYLHERSSTALVALALLAAGAMQCKVIGVIWLAPLLLVIAYRAWTQRIHRKFTLAQWLFLGAAVVIALWPYANAWMRTGNPVFPFMNALFKSPSYYTGDSFNNMLYNSPLRPWSLYEILLSSGRFIEGFNGAAGFHWLLLLPVVVLAFMRRRSPAQWLCLALAVIYFVGVYSQQSYLRYLLPFFALFAMLGGWALAEIPDSRATRVAILVVGVLACVANVRFMYTASWANLTLCTACGVDNRARLDYVALYAADRVSSDYLNRNLPEARVGFYMLGGNPAGFIGYSRAASWHDYPTYRALTEAESADDVLANAKEYALTHIVYRDPPWETENAAMRAFRERYAEPVFRANGIVVAVLRLPKAP